MPRIRHSLQDLFGISLRTSYLCRFRRSLYLEYRPLVQELLQHILRSPVLHIDETHVRLKDKKGYVWVLTSLDAVYFLYRPNREGGFLSELLRSFSGVLVSDFYGAYDSLPCRQQKCLVHFVRDIDDDLLKNPLDGELKRLGQEFGTLLKSVIETVDRFGLRRRHLSKHRKDVAKFLAAVQARELSSPVAKGYQQRFQKSGAKLFTFLEHDHIPWNNNYAEHAIKRFARYRRVFDGSFTEHSLEEYLVLASVLSTCEFNKLNALTFLLSGKTSVADLIKVGRKRGGSVLVKPLAREDSDALAEQTGMPLSPPIAMCELACTDVRWKELCRTHLEARREVQLTDFDADKDREWCHYEAARHGARCRVRKRPRLAMFTFAMPR